MKYLGGKYWSHSSLAGGPAALVSDIRRSTPRDVSTFRELVVHVARILYHNRQLSLFFRGQGIEYWDDDARTSILPAIYRGIRSPSAASAALEPKYHRLNVAERLLDRAFKQNCIEADETFDISQPVRWAILQHYGVCDTPLVDLTSSLRAACSFALLRARSEGIVYVVGLPHINSCVSHHMDDRLINLKLQGICPPSALRPYFQDGYLVCSLPYDRPDLFSLEFDLARRLLAKFRIQKAGFWDSQFPAIPEDALLPPSAHDQMLQVCEAIRKHL